MDPIGLLAHVMGREPNSVTAGLHPRDARHQAGAPGARPSIWAIHFEWPFGWPLGGCAEEGVAFCW